MNNGACGGSFRDPNGFVFIRGGQLYRQVNERYRSDFDLLVGSGLYERLAAGGLLVRHEETDRSLAVSDDAYKVIRPERIPFISYPHEWCFSQLKDAALATLAIQKLSIEHGMSLKDCSAYNVQFSGGKPVFIDTLSFERYREGEPWVGYRQFCQHFLAPLALMSYTDVRLGQLFRVYMDGIPLDLASELLPFRTRLSFSLLTHIHVHARYQRRYEGTTESPKGRRRMGRGALAGLIESLESSVRRLAYAPEGTEWADYYDETNYTQQAMEGKVRLVGEFISGMQPGTVWDLGANTGRFSILAAERGHSVVSFDIDPAAVERNYLECAAAGRSRILPLLLDLANPSSGMGWGGEERMSLFERGPADAALALALLHHLAIGNNLPFEMIARFMNRICNVLVIEFVPKEDPQVRRMLVCREDVFDHYTRERFEAAFGELFAIERAERIVDTERTLYRMRSKQQEEKQ